MHILSLCTVARSLLTGTRRRPGANPWRVINQIRTKLKIPAAAVQVPIGVEDELKGVVDLVRWKSVYNEGVKGYVLNAFGLLYAYSSSL